MAFVLLLQRLLLDTALISDAWQKVPFTDRSVLALLSRSSGVNISQSCIHSCPFSWACMTGRRLLSLSHKQEVLSKHPQGSTTKRDPVSLQCLYRPETSKNKEILQEGCSAVLNPSCYDLALGESERCAHHGHVAIGRHKV